MSRLPIVDVAPLFGNEEVAGRQTAAETIGAACRDSGFFYAIGHGISADLLAGLRASAAHFFALPEEQKMQIAMARGGRAWRGYFPVGSELTSGRPDLKEGLYFGEELGLDDARVRAGLPLHGANLFPENSPELRTLVLDYMRAATNAAHAIMQGVALGLGLEASYFRDHYTAQPTVLFRIFHYPPSAADEDSWGVGEHTDYGLLTLLAQDDVPGLQVKTPGGWIDAPPIEGALVCNIGDMLDRLSERLSADGATVTPDGRRVRVEGVESGTIRDALADLGLALIRLERRRLHLADLFLAADAGVELDTADIEARAEEAVR